MMLATPRLTLVILAALVFNVASAQAAATTKESVDLRREPVTHGDSQAGAAKAATCGACHGPQGNAPVPAFPSLAGQSVTYLYLQLRAFKDGSRGSDVMRPEVESLSEQDMKDLAAYYASLQPARSATATPAANTNAGQQIFTQGDAVRGVPACQACHVPDGRGPQRAVTPASNAVSNPSIAWHTIPALAGQHAQYCVAQLKDFKSGARSTTTNARIMQGVARNLDESAMAEIAAYVNQLGPQ